MGIEVPVTDNDSNAVCFMLTQTNEAFTSGDWYGLVLIESDKYSEMTTSGWVEKTTFDLTTGTDDAIEDYEGPIYIRAATMPSSQCEISAVRDLQSEYAYSVMEDCTMRQ